LSSIARAARAARGGRERGLVVHKLIEEVLTGETPEQAEALETRARTLLLQLDVTGADRSDPTSTVSEGSAPVSD
jgi:hypothetical protein